MALKAFRVKGAFQMGRNRTTFTVETADVDDASARLTVLSTIGSRHRVKRRAIQIDDVQEIGKDDVTDPVVEHRLEVSA